MIKILFAAFLSVSFSLTAIATPTCPTGQYWDSSMGMCMPNPTCPTGQFWDTSMSPPMCMPIPAPTTYKGIYQNIFSKSCVTCHMAMGSNPAEAGIDFSSYALMMASNQSTTNSNHAPFIIAGDPKHSKLYLGLQSGMMPANENGTPAGKLSDDLIQNVYDWIKAGAQNN